MGWLTRNLTFSPPPQEATKNDQSKFPYTYKVLDYDHLDFTLADDAYIYVYSKILEHIP